MPRRPEQPDPTPRRERGAGRIYFDKTKKRWVAALTVEGKVTERLLKTEAEAKATLNELTALEARGRLKRSRVSIAMTITCWQLA
jgi:hypothetical protein